jgi:hypothetical protein
MIMIKKKSNLQFCAHVTFINSSADWAGQASLFIPQFQCQRQRRFNFQHPDHGNISACFQNSTMFKGSTTLHQDRFVKIYNSAGHHLLVMAQKPPLSEKQKQ